MPPLARRLGFVAFAAVVSLWLLLHFSGWDQQVPFGGLYYNRQRPIAWSLIPQRYPVAPSDLHRLPLGTPGKIGKIQFDFPTETEDAQRRRLQRRDAVKKELVHSWKGYRKHAWMHDEVTPLTGLYKDPFGGWGATLVDTLDTLLIADLHDEFAVALAALKKIDFTRPGAEILNVFETTIRYLGGLLSANDLTDGKYPILKEKALELGEMLYHAFDTPNRMPVTRWWWELNTGGIEQEAGSNTLSAELGSLSLEFTRLSQISGDSKYFDAVQRIAIQLENTQDQSQLPGLWPIVINAADMSVRSRYFTFGGMSDSMYEYLPKQYLLLGGKDLRYETMYEKVLKQAQKVLFFRPYNPQNLDILISGMAMHGFGNVTKLVPEGQHLTCFAAGMVALAAKTFSNPDELATARKLLHGCIWAANSTSTGIMPELFRAAPCEDPSDCKWDVKKWYDGINKEQMSYDGPNPTSLYDRAEKLAAMLHLPPGFTDVRDRRYLLRPEVVESLFVLYRITGDGYYQDEAWRLFNAVVKACRTSISYAALSNVTVPQGQTSQIDSSESFWMAETLKYFYLIFSEPDLISLDDYVFNTEAHPLKRPKSL